MLSNLKFVSAAKYFAFVSQTRRHAETSDAMLNHQFAFGFLAGVFH